MPIHNADSLPKRKKPPQKATPVSKDETDSAVSIPENVYYLTTTKEYLTRNPAGRWITHNDGGFKRWLRALGYRTKLRENETISDCERVMLHIQDHADVDFAGAVAGRKMGFHKENGVRFLVTTEAELVEATSGEWPTIRAYVDGLLGTDPTHGEEQVAVFHGWVRAAYRSLMEERHTHGQALTLCGIQNSGKSCAQALIITPMLGGRAGKAARYMMGQTPFNSDLCGAEHLVLDDEFMSTNMTARLQLAANLKQMCVGTNIVSVHAKNRNAVNLRVWWRTSISVNDDPEAMLVLPPLDEHVADKLIILRCHRFDQPMPMRTPEQKAAFAAQMRSELPAYAHWLLHDFVLPPALENDRYGVASFHHPELVEALHGLSPEAHLLSLADEVLFKLGAVEWRGTAEELKRELAGDDRVRRDVEKLLAWNNATGTYLGRLAKRPTPRVTKNRTQHSREWIITRHDDSTAHVFP